VTVEDQRSWLGVTYHHPIKINVVESKKRNEESLLLLCLLLIPISNPILNEESLLSPAAFHQFIHWFIGFSYYGK